MIPQSENLYATPAQVKTHLGITDAVDSYFTGLLEQMSRAIDSTVRRHFFTVQAAKVVVPNGAQALFLDDLLAVEELAVDTLGTGYTEVWAETDYQLEPLNKWPKVVVRTTPWGFHAFVENTRVRITGRWGYGDGRSAAPWRSLGITAAGSDSETVLTVTGSLANVEAGMTLRAVQGGSEEQIFVREVGETTITVDRGLNGTTAIILSGAALYRALYPPEIVRVCIDAAARVYQKRKNPDLKSEEISDSSYKYEYFQPGGSAQNPQATRESPLSADEEHALSRFVRRYY